MPRSTLPPGGWLGIALFAGAAAWACSDGDTNPFSNPARGGSGGDAGSATGGMSGAMSGTSSGGDSTLGGTSGSSTGGDGTGGDGTGGMPTGGSFGEGGEGAVSGTDAGGSSGASGSAGDGGSPNGGVGGSAGAMAGGGAGGMGNTGGGGGGNVGGSGGSAGTGGSGGAPGDACKSHTDCAVDEEYCKKSGCDVEEGRCQPLGAGCRGANAAFSPVCGCDGITYYNVCTLEREGINVAHTGECTGDNRPTCSRDDGGGASCPPRARSVCYRPRATCNDVSPITGVCWVLPDECPNEPATHRYCGGTSGGARCTGLCEILEVEDSFRRDAPACM